jgi:hypothetical protein
VQHLEPQQLRLDDGQVTGQGEQPQPGGHEVPFTWKVLLTLAERDLRQALFSQARSTFQLINTASSMPVMNGPG